MILLPKYRDVILPQATSRVGMRGFFKLEAIRPDGRIRPLTDWFPNLITDVGLNYIGQGSYLNACHVGTNNTAPTFADTSLAGYRAGTTTKQAVSTGNTNISPYYCWKRITYRFSTPGSASGNIAEVGIASIAALSGSILFSRALVLDEFGVPTTVTVLSDEVLDVTYELRLYPPLVDVTGSFDITGSGTHSYTLRASSVTSNIAWGYYLGSVASMSHREYELDVYNGAIGTITQTPSGSGAGANLSNAAYGNNNLYRDASGGYGLNYGNLSGGIKSVRFETTLGAFQYEVTPVIAKDNTNTLSLTQRVLWGRYTP
jgi:hypothetical protein